MKGKTYVYAGTLALTAAAGIGVWTAQIQANPPSAPNVPVFKVDTSFPKPLPVAGQFGTPLKVSTATGKPLPWVTGEVAGTCVDSQDHVFTVNRGNLISPETNVGSATQTGPTAVPSPTVIEFDPDGNVVNAWDPHTKDGTLANQAQIHGCFVDYQDNIWIAGNGDGIVLKYSHDGSTLLLQIGTKGVCDNPPANTCGNSGANPLANMSQTLLNEPANVWIDPGADPQSGKRGAVYITDGYGNHRVVVFQDNGDGTATYLRQWGYVAGTVNNPLTDFLGGFAAGDGGHPHCVVGGNDGLIYVCDRADDRIEVFTKTGSATRAPVRVIPVVPGTGQTLGIGGVPGLATAGSAWDFRFTNDALQTYMIEVDGGNEIMHTMNRMLGTIVSDLGQPGHEPGQFTFLHSNTVDSQGNVYTGETINGRRIQKFVHVQCNNGNGQGNANGNCS